VSAPATAPAPAAERRWTDETTLSGVRPAVRDILSRSAAYSSLPHDDQRALARDLVKVSSYLANPEGAVADERQTLAQAQERPPSNAERAGAAATRTESAGADFTGGAIRQGTDQFTRLVQAVDFPKFVSGLIHNVFEAIVDSSIKQMRAYGELVANVAKTVDQFAADNITENNARDWLASKYPDKLAVETSNLASEQADGDPAPPPQARLVTIGDNPEQSLAEVAKDLGLTRAPTDLSDDQSEAELVRRAKLQIARGRQQLLASMVLLGINRIVVTDGVINAKVVFDLRATDSLKRMAKASLLDSDAVKSKTQYSQSFGGWLNPINADLNTEVDTSHVATVQSSVDDTSESRAALKANLTGEVRINFKSDYVPMERMATPQMIASIQGNANPVDPNVPAQAATAPRP
jgi:hypothetical protein